MPHVDSAGMRHRGNTPLLSPSLHLERRRDAQHNHLWRALALPTGNPAEHGYVLSDCHQACRARDSQWRHSGSFIGHSLSLDPHTRALRSKHTGVPRKNPGWERVLPPGVLVSHVMTCRATATRPGHHPGGRSPPSDADVGIATRTRPPARRLAKRGSGAPSHLCSPRQPG